jgi:hypothetical protein
MNGCFGVELNVEETQVIKNLKATVYSTEYGK